jgi:hypothetical protein
MTIAADTAAVVGAAHADTGAVRTCRRAVLGGPRRRNWTYDFEKRSAHQLLRTAPPLFDVVQ